MVGSSKNSFTIFFLDYNFLPEDKPYEIDHYRKIAKIDKGEWNCHIPDDVFANIQNRVVVNDRGEEKATIHWSFQQRRGLMVGDLVRDDDTQKIYYLQPKGVWLEYENIKAMIKDARR